MLVFRDGALDAVLLHWFLALDLVFDDRNVLFSVCDMQCKRTSAWQWFQWRADALAMLAVSFSSGLSFVQALCGCCFDHKLLLDGGADAVRALVVFKQGENCLLVGDATAHFVLRMVDGRELEECNDAPALCFGNLFPLPSSIDWVQQESLREQRRAS